MAAKTVVTNEAKVCNICRESYDNPKLLPCIHAFCKKCLQDIGTKTDKNAGDTMPCPICGKDFSIPAEGFDGLQTDFFLSRLTRDRWCAACLERMNESADTDAPWAVVWCSECQLEARNCEHHPREKLIFYCADCEKVLCDLCFDENHQNHRIQRTKRAAANFCNEFKDRPLSGINSETLRRIEEFKYGKLELGGIAKCLRENVQKRREKIEELLDKHVQSLLQDIDSEELRLLRDYESISKDYELHLTCLVSFEVYFREIMARGSSDDICCAMTNFIRRSKELVEIHESLSKLKAPQYSLQFRESDLEEFFSNDGFNIIGSIPVFGRTRSTKASRKEQLVKLDEMINDLKLELKETIKENRNWKTEVERLKQDLELHQSSIEVQGEPTADVNEREERSRVEIESLQQQLEQMTAAQQLMERQIDFERTGHQELTRRIGDLEDEQTRSHMEIDQLNHDISVLKKLLPDSNPRGRSRCQVDKEFGVQVMRATSANVDIKVTGLAVLEGELFMTTSDNNVVEIRDLNNIQTLKRRVKVNDLDDPYDICSCPTKLCLYIFDKNSRKIFSIDKTGSNTAAAWTTGDGVGTLSVAEDSNVILILHQDSKLKEYDSSGGIITEIELFKFGIDWPTHAVKLSRKYYVVSHGNDRHRLRRVCIADIEEGATILSFGEVLGWQMRREITPYYLARTAAGYIMVTDRESNSVLLLKNNLEYDKVIIENLDYFSHPEAHLLAERFCLDEGRSLIVASNFKENGLWAGSVGFFPLMTSLDTVTT